MSGNTALTSNPPTAGVDINTNGSNWLWAAFALFALSDLGAIAWGWSQARGARIFHWLAVAILSVATIAYFTMASDLGSTPVLIEFFGNRHQDYGVTRAIWYVRYIQWVVNFPLLLLTVLLASGTTASDMFATVFMSILAVIAGLIGALVPSTYKWGYFVFGVIALVFVIFHLVGPARAAAGAVGNDIRTNHTRGAAFLSFLFVLYPIAWGLSEGGNVITSDGEMVFYGVLDLFAGPVFLYYFLWSLRSIELTRFGFGNASLLHRPLAEKPAAVSTA